MGSDKPRQGERKEERKEERKKSDLDEPASYGTVGAHLGLGSMSRTGREGVHGSSFEATHEELAEEEKKEKK